MGQLENKYIILPKNGFKSETMRQLDEESISTHSVHVSGGTVHFDIIDSISKDGPKIVTMPSAEARELRYSDSDFRISPMRQYQPAIRDIVHASRKALDDYEGESVQTRIFIKEDGTGKPLSDVDVIVIVDRERNAGIRRRSGQTGQLTITLPRSASIEQIFVYPPAGYWGKYHENHVLSDDEVIYLKRIEPRYRDYLRQYYRTPRAGNGKGVRIAVVDTGVDAEHDELTVVKSTNCVLAESETDLAPSGGHGTHVAGIIAARNYGIAPGVELYSYRVFPQTGSANTADIARAIDTAVDDECDLINLSLGGGMPDVVLSEAIGYAYEHGIVSIVAAGNSQRKPVSYPAWFKRSIAVSAIGKVGTFPGDSIDVVEVADPRAAEDNDIFFAGFSNLGREIDCCAPGVGIVSTWPGNRIAVESGTSMSCPVVTGVAAGLLSSNIDVLSARRDVIRSIGIVELIQRACNSLGLPQVYEGIGLPAI